jgi:DNA-binding beta-propeller fold protein YncE
VAVDRRNNVYASDTEQDRIVKFSPTGHVLARWGEPGTDTGQFHLPYGIAVDARGNLYVADSGNDRIQKLAVGR